MPKVIPFGDRLLVKRRQVGEKSGSIILPDSTKERDTDLADVVYVPDHSFADKELIENSEEIIGSLAEEAKTGQPEALKALLQFNAYLKIKTIKKGDAVMISKYVGTTFHDNQGSGNLTLVNSDDIIGAVIDE